MIWRYNPLSAAEGHLPGDLWQVADLPLHTRHSVSGCSLLLPRRPPLDALASAGTHGGGEYGGLSCTCLWLVVVK